MKHTFTLFVITLCSIFLLTGCGQKLPDGMPKLYPCEILVTQDSAPLADATIVLTTPDDTFGWVVSGLTDASGKAVMTTNANYVGTPVGEFVVKISKMHLEEGKPVNPSNPMGKFHPSYEVHSVDVVYRETKTSPLKVKVEPGKNQFDFDVGKKVEDRIRVPGT